MNKYSKYKCVVAPNDVVTAYVTDAEKVNEDLFALVNTNADGGKISVLLNKADATALRNQLNEFVDGPEIVFPCRIKFTAHTYSGTSRTATYQINDQEELDNMIDWYMSDTTGQTKSVTHCVYHKKG